jgi:hypothetical protein
MYTNQLGVGQLVPGATGVGALSVATTGAKGEYAAVGGQVAVSRIALCVSTALGAGAAVVEIRLRPTVGSATSEAAIATLTIPASTAAGKVVYKDLNEVIVAPGQSISVQVTSASAAGNILFGFLASEDPEYKANVSSMIASA